MREARSRGGDSGRRRAHHRRQAPRERSIPLLTEHRWSSFRERSRAPGGGARAWLHTGRSLLIVSLLARTQSLEPEVQDAMVQ